MLTLCAASTIGCNNGSQKTPEPPGGGTVAYVAEGYVSLPGVIHTLKLVDPDERLKEFEAESFTIRDCFIVPAPIFDWLMKQARHAREYEP